ncbi:MAG: Ig-like domain-containing protein, partial [Ignavibacteriae bacterium]|nr:Ig-like domain-containing protein [Ignavibacteriota bacterium]
MITHRTLSVAMTAVLFFSFIFFACKEDEGPTGIVTPDPTTVEGTIYDKLALPIGGAEISMRASFAPADTTVSDSRGNYKFVVQWPDTGSRGWIVLTATKTGYYSKTDSFNVEAAKTYSKSYSLTSKADTITPGPNSSGIARLVFISASHSFANVKGVGKRESIVFTFEARDSADVPLDSAHQANIAFRIMPAIDGGEKLAPETTKTSFVVGSNGRVTTTLTSGHKAGIVQVEASVVDIQTINATSPAIPIYSGPPDAGHFTVALEKLNFPGLGFLGVQNKVTVQVGDKWGNPVPDSTAIYFSTSGGIIQPAALTDEVGIAQVTLSSGNSQPADGFGWVYASTVGDSGKLVKDSIRVLFSGAPRVEPQDFDFTITDGGSLLIPFKVFDKNRNPLSTGTRITVTFSGDATSELAFSGDIDVTMPDTQDSTFTQFKINARDTVVQSPSSDKGLLMTINISGPNGNMLRSYVGLLRGTGGTVTTSGTPASIVLTGLTTNTVSVHGTGSNETAIMTFLVRDKSGRSIPQDSATVDFEIIGPDGGVSLFPTSVQTDAQGRVQTALTSGTIAGVVQVVASIDTGGVTRLASTPVSITIAGGLPDQNHFSIAVGQLNIPGLVRYGVTDNITVYVGDEYGNPVQPNTAVYFTTTGGYVEASAYTNTSGIASTTLRSAEPEPRNGYATVTATTIDKNNNEVKDSVFVLFSGFPIITASNYNIQLADDSSFSLWFGVHDRNHNHLSSGTQVQVSVGGRNSSEIQLYGDISTTLPDALYGGYRLDTFFVNIVDKVGGSLRSGQFDITISVSGPNGAIALPIPGILLATRTPKIKSLTLLSNVPRELSIAGVGGVDTLQLEYQILDSLNQVINRTGERVDFEFTGRFGEFSPSYDETDNDGKVQTTFHTGEVVESVKVRALVPNSDVVSVEKTIFIRPGSPHPGNARLIVSMPNDTIPKVNFAAKYSRNEQVGKVKIQIKDENDNPVPGEKIEFETNAGEIRATVFTDVNGFGSAIWYGGPNVPVDGNAVIKVVWKKGTTSVVLDSSIVTYSGAALIAGGPEQTDTLIAGSGKSYSYFVRDANGNPLAEGTQISVSKYDEAASSILLTGDTSMTMTDTRDTNLTKFTFDILDTNTTILTPRKLGIKIKVTGPNGNALDTSRSTVKGYVPTSDRIKFVVLMKSQPRIYVSGVNRTDTDTLLYELQDSSGARMPTPGLTVAFDFQGQQGEFTPQYAETDINGRVQTIFRSGEKAETVKVFAQLGRIISSKQDIVVLPGPPAQSFFGFNAVRSGGTDSKVNFPGMFSSNNKIGELQVSLGDTHGNPVINNTRVTFLTNAGFVQSSGFTQNGRVLVNWLGGEPFPSNGIANLVAATTDQNNQQMSKNLSLVYSGQAVVTSSLNNGFVFRQGIDSSFTYSVADSNGNPLAEGTTINVSATGTGANSVLVSGDVNVTMSDVSNPAYTQFNINLQDTNTTFVGDRTLRFEISVAGPNGSVIKRVTTTLQGIIPPPVPRVAGIRLESVSVPVLTVKDGGGTETSLLTYQILDSLGNPIRKEGIQLVMSGTGIPFLFTPETTTTNASGQAQTLFHSDTVAGIVQVIARTVSGFVQSSPSKIVIVGGKPSQQFFTFLLTRPNATGEKVNYPGAMPLIQKIGEAQVQAGDRYGNPVPAGTPIYFTTNAGVIQGSAFTDTNGFAKVEWFGGNPVPVGGAATVKASASGEGTSIVVDSTVVTYSGQVMIGGGPQPGFEIIGAGSTTFGFTVRDANGNPPAEGSRVLVSVSGSGANAVVLSGDVNVTMPDTRDSSLSRFT